ncbi:MAG TPA: NAD(P)H-dependent glycerol-3-phosphate dehydrogenase [Candidatus Goldiibacteriota bacterium]|nr:NAD(P)H-dependent glycerol-3-phosphate dehydrogenase [Candidatus Goldiibacteriota bacterium]
MRVSVIGAGGWGTALAVILCERHNEVTVWEYFPEYAALLDRKRENVKFLPGVKIPRQIRITHDLKEAVDASDAIVLAVPSHALRGLLKKIRKLNYRKKLFISVMKGIEQDTLLTMSGVIKDVLGKVKVAVLSGPSHAEEVARKTPTTVVAASSSPAVAEKVQHMFFTNSFRVYSSSDVLGVELGGSVKNVIAIAAGILDGMGVGDNTKAALITRGLAEMRRLGTAMGADEATFFGLSGIGDLVVTCASRHSRNRRVGEQLGRGKKIGEILKGMEMVAEGVKTTKSVHVLAKKRGVDMPITAEVYEVIYRGKAPMKSMADLMKRPAKSEKELLNKNG